MGKKEDFWVRVARAELKEFDALTKELKRHEEAIHKILIRIRASKVRGVKP